MFASIIVCSDGSEHALKAALVAAEIASRFDSEVCLLCVETFAPISPALFTGSLTYDTQEALESLEDAQRSAERRTGKVFEAMGVRYRCLREVGHAVDRIVAVAEQERADLIVLGSRGLGSFQRLLLGSVSDGVLHHAHCPVL